MRITGSLDIRLFLERKQSRANPVHNSNESMNFKEEIANANPNILDSSKRLSTLGFVHTLVEQVQTIFNLILIHSYNTYATFR